MRANTTPALLLFAGAALLHADRPGPEFQARLATPVASFSPTGTPFTAKVLGALTSGGEGGLPPGSIVQGVVRRANPIGLGLKRERSILELDFQSCQLPAGDPVECNIKLVAVDNARESVNGDNRIEGILAAAHPHSWLQGVWYRPTSGFLRRSSTGLTGAGGKIQSRFLPTPTGAAVVIGSRLALMRLPDPEILLPAGTDLVLRISAMNSAAARTEPKSEDDPLSPKLGQWLSQRPAEIRHSSGAVAADLINIALIGTKEALLHSFGAAGWTVAEPLNAKTFARTYSAYSSMRSYPSAPVSPLYYEGRLPDTVLQRSHNSLAMRHHIRFWEVESPEGPVWLGAATHDIAIDFDWKRVALSHRIDLRIDRERSTVMNDLREARCLGDRASIARPELLSLPSRTAITDGDLVAGVLQSCIVSEPRAPGLKRPRHGVPTRLVRRAVLETRQYFVRGSAYYRIYQGMRWAVVSWRGPKPHSASGPLEGRSIEGE